MLAAVPAAAQTFYSNGPTNGNTDAWTVNFGFIVSDTFNTSNTPITGVTFAVAVPGRHSDDRLNCPSPRARTAAPATLTRR
jgi:hypothetical protein